MCVIFYVWSQVPHTRGLTQINQLTVHKLTMLHRMYFLTIGGIWQSYQHFLLILYSLFTMNWSKGMKKAQNFAQDLVLLVAFWIGSSINIQILRCQPYNKNPTAISTKIFNKQMSGSFLTNEFQKIYWFCTTQDFDQNCEM